jgi:hypothetical protein
MNQTELNDRRATYLFIKWKKTLLLILLFCLVDLQIGPKTRQECYYRPIYTPLWSQSNGIWWLNQLNRMETVDAACYVFISITRWRVWANTLGDHLYKCIQTFLRRHKLKNGELGGASGLCWPYILCTSVREIGVWARVVTACSVVILVTSCSASSRSGPFIACRNGRWLCTSTSSVTRQQRTVICSYPWPQFAAITSSRRRRTGAPVTLFVVRPKLSASRQKAERRTV